jgi:hypothetical protein
LLLIWSRSQGVSHKGYVSKPPVPEDRQANRLCDEAAKKKKDAAREAAAKKREREEKHKKECKIAWNEGRPPPPTPDSTAGEDSSDSEPNFSESDDYEVVTGASPPSAPRGADGEGSPMVLGVARLAPGSLVDPPAARAERRSPPPASGGRTPAPAASMGGEGSMASADTPVQTASRHQTDPRVTPSGQSSGGVSVPRARRSSTGKRSMSARSG